MENVDVTKIKHHPYVVTVGAETVGPLKEAPSVEPEQELHECLIYENGRKEAVASYLIKNNSTITLTTMNIDYALAQIEAAKIGDNIYAADKKQVITFTPVTESSTQEKTLVFSNCYLVPELSFTPGFGGECSTAKLVYKAKPDPETKKLYTWASAGA